MRLLQSLPAIDSEVASDVLRHSLLTAVEEEALSFAARVVPAPFDEVIDVEPLASAVVPWADILGGGPPVARDHNPPARQRSRGAVVPGVNGPGRSERFENGALCRAGREVMGLSDACHCDQQGDRANR